MQVLREPLQTCRRDRASLSIQIKCQFLSLTEGETVTHVDVVHDEYNDDRRHEPEVQLANKSSLCFGPCVRRKKVSIGARNRSIRRWLFHDRVDFLIETCYFSGRGVHRCHANPLCSSSGGEAGTHALDVVRPSIRERHGSPTGLKPTACTAARDGIVGIPRIHGHDASLPLYIALECCHGDGLLPFGGSSDTGSEVILSESFHRYRTTDRKSD